MTVGRLVLLTIFAISTKYSMQFVDLQINLNDYFINTILYLIKLFSSFYAKNVQSSYCTIGFSRFGLIRLPRENCFLLIHVFQNVQLFLVYYQCNKRFAYSQWNNYLMNNFERNVYEPKHPQESILKERNGSIVCRLDQILRNQLYLFTFLYIYQY